MSTVKELKEWLNNFPEETIVQVIGEKGTYEPLDMPDKPIDNTIWNGGIAFGDRDSWEYVDFTENKYVSPDAAWFGKKYLRIGCKTF